MNTTIGLGPKKLHQLCGMFGMRTLANLARAASEGGIRDLPRFIGHDRGL
jgi:hypothetical protein